VVARRAHNPKVVGSNPTPATKQFNKRYAPRGSAFFIEYGYDSLGCEFRPLGVMIAQCSTHWALIGLTVLLQILLVESIELGIGSLKKEVVLMVKITCRLSLPILLLLTIWASKFNSVAGALSA
jgi:hypothetical protein